MNLEKRVKQWHLCSRRRADPDQRHAPALIGIAGDVRVSAQARQSSDAFGAAVFAAGQVLGEEQRQNRVVRVLPHQAFKALARLGPVRIVEAQVGVVLAAHSALRQTAVEQLAKQPGRLVTLTGVGQASGVIQQRLILRLAKGNVLLQLHRLPGHWRQRLQARQVGLRLLRFVLFDADQAHAIKRLHLIGIDQQDFLPDFGGAHCVRARLPVLALLDQLHLHGGTLGMRYAGCNCGNQPDD
ncbi:hypothetical protein ALP75_201238 [Pseudomonas syringae pv. actinidiae]|nr:hypothetical protein ALP75_201238 [Pseudomonas syringae pv. actinidiae]